MINWTILILIGIILLLWLSISKVLFSGIPRSGLSGKAIRSVSWVILTLFLYGFVELLFDDGAEDLGGGYTYSYDSSHAIHGPGIDVPPEIIDCRYDHRFIIVKQRLNGLKPQREYYELYDYDYPSLYGDYYWIIDKGEDTLYGPLERQEFDNISDSLGISLSQMKRSIYL